MPAPLKRPPFDLNDTVSLEVTFTNTAGARANPGAFALRLVCPDRTIINKTRDDCEEIELGRWKYLYTVANGIGNYKGTWTAHSTGDIVRQFSFPVRKPDSG